ncbi:Hypothetical predicted protein [Xyrichtys novacula]|uniref:Uncharacterized protein n=1 Tax=Xyrichtys novacula TaxID=13765 RepID=A0AAV1EMJ1_XYRNO|nr:Hypothetical predicted protein [Xyrichtys novacula]
MEQPPSPPLAPRAVEPGTKVQRWNQMGPVVVKEDGEEVRGIPEDESVRSLREDPISSKGGRCGAQFLYSLLRHTGQSDASCSPDMWESQRAVVSALPQIKTDDGESKDM